MGKNGQSAIKCKPFATVGSLSEREREKDRVRGRNVCVYFVGFLKKCQKEKAYHVSSFMLFFFFFFQKKKNLR